MPSSNTPFPLPPIVSVLPYALIVLGVSTKSKQVRRLVFILNTCIIIWVIRYTTAGIVFDYATGSGLAALIFMMSDFLLLKDPLKELRLRTPSDSQFRDVNPENLSFYERCKWSLRLITSPRMIGWSTEPTGILPSQPPSWSHNQPILHFLRNQCAILVVEVFIIIATASSSSLLSKLAPIFVIDGPHLAELPWSSRSFITSLLGLGMVAMLDSTHRMWMIALVGIGGWKPSEFRPFFGSFAHACTLRGLWGRSWHQQHRRKFLIHARFLTTLFHLPLKSPISLLLSLYVAFLISGMMHLAGDYMTLHHLGGGSLKFFLVQAIGVSIEAAAIELRKRLFGKMVGPRELLFWRVSGYVWVWQWFVWSVPIMFEPLLEGGLAEPIRKFHVPVVRLY